MLHLWDSLSHSIVWTSLDLLADLPHGAGYKYAALAANMSTLYVVGRRSSDGRSLRSVFSYDLSTRTWSRPSDMREVRWYHGAVIIGTRYDDHDD